MHFVEMQIDADSKGELALYRRHRHGFEVGGTKSGAKRRKKISRCPPVLCGATATAGLQHKIGGSVKLGTPIKLRLRTTQWKTLKR